MIQRFHGGTEYSTGPIETHVVAKRPNVDAHEQCDGQRSLQAGIRGDRTAAGGEPPDSGQHEDQRGEQKNRPAAKDHGQADIAIHLREGGARQLITKLDNRRFPIGIRSHVDGRGQRNQAKQCDEQSGRPEQSQHQSETGAGPAGSFAGHGIPLTPPTPSPIKGEGERIQGFAPPSPFMGEGGRGG